LKLFVGVETVSKNTTVDFTHTHWPQQIWVKITITGTSYEPQTNLKKQTNSVFFFDIFCQV